MAVATLSSAAMGCTANLVAAGEPAPIMVVSCNHCLGRKKQLPDQTYPIDDCVSHMLSENLIFASPIAQFDCDNLKGIVAELLYIC